jgi:hypothetical protein
VLGRALLAARTDANSFWILLSGNAEVAIQSSTATTPTPVTASATSNAAAVVPAPAAVTVTATRAVSKTGASAASTVCQKRKAHP